MAYDVGYQPPTILIPLARKAAVVMNPFQVPYSLRGKVSGMVADRSGAKEIGHAFGRTTKPDKPFLVYANGDPIMIVGDGVTEAAELEDLALMALERQEERAKRDWKAERRERLGYPDREKFDELYREALQRRIAQHKANPITDPPRRVRYEV